MAEAACIVKREVAPLDFTPEQSQMIRDTYANGASEGEFKVLMEVARVRRLNPLTRQIWFIQRWDDQKKRMVWQPQVSIDGLRSIAERTGLYDGQDEPEYIRSGANLECCKVRVYRKDWARPAVGVAFLDEFIQKTKDGNVTKMWREKTHIMLAKCAEALALRKAFPEDTAGLYVPEEMPEMMGEEMREAAEAREQKRAPRKAKDVEVLPPEPKGLSSTTTLPAAYQTDLAKALERFKTPTESPGQILPELEPPPLSDKDMPPLSLDDFRQAEETVKGKPHPLEVIPIGKAAGLRIATADKRRLETILAETSDWLANPKFQKHKHRETMEAIFHAVGEALEKKAQEAQP